MALPPPNFAVWAIAHGDPATVGEQPPTRAWVVDRAIKEGIVDADARYSRLIADGALAEVKPSPTARRAFAEKYRLLPLALGLGNSPEAPQHFFLGMANDARVAVTAQVYSLWMFGHRSPTLWQACKTVATDLSTGSQKLTAEELLAQLMQLLPLMVSVNCVCVDRRGYG